MQRVSILSNKKKVFDASGEDQDIISIWIILFFTQEVECPIVLFWKVSAAHFPLNICANN